MIKKPSPDFLEKSQSCFVGAFYGSKYKGDPIKINQNLNHDPSQMHKQTDEFIKTENK